MTAARIVDDLDIDRVAELLHREIGLPVESSLRSRVRRCTHDGAAARRISVSDYVDELMVRGAAYQELLNEITVQETGFFRHPEQFDVLARNVLPGLAQPLKIWSAGCANGQEAYSLALLMDELGIDGTVVATDLSTDALSRTVAGRYSAREVRGLSERRVERYLTRDGDTWELNAALRRRVTTVRHNLVDPIPREAYGSQVVFCRNILIYLSPTHVRTYVDRLVDSLPEAVIFIGAAEVLWQVTDSFLPVRVDSTFYYRRRRDEPVPLARPRAFHPVAAPFPAVTRRTKHLTSTAKARLPVVEPTGRSAPDERGAAATLTRTGEQAIAAGDHRSAVVAFRACAYLTPQDPIAHLHLGLAFEATGDRSAAARAYGVARRTLLATDPTTVERTSEGYTFAELLSLLDAKRQGVSR